MTVSPLALHAILPAALGAPARLGVITATTTKNNSDTAVPFGNTGDMLEGKMLELDADTACYIKFGTASTVAATALAYDVFLSSHTPYTVLMTNGMKYIACLPVSGTTVLQVDEKF